MIEEKKAGNKKKQDWSEAKMKAEKEERPIPEEPVVSKPGPTIPPIHLYNLHRRKIHLEIVKDKEDPKKIGKLVFHMFDVEDDLTFEKVVACLKTIFEFMTYHEILRPFSINIYT